MGGERDGRLGTWSRFGLGGWDADLSGGLTGRCVPAPPPCVRLVLRPPTPHGAYPSHRTPSHTIRITHSHSSHPPIFIHKPTQGSCPHNPPLPLTLMLQVHQGVSRVLRRMDDLHACERMGGATSARHAEGGWPEVRPCTLAWVARLAMCDPACARHTL